MFPLTELKKELRERNRGIDIIENAPMSQYTSFKAGGAAAALTEVKNVEELKAMLEILTERAIPHMILGNGSNTLFKDSGYEGVVIRLRPDCFSDVSFQEDSKGERCLVKAGSAILLSTLAKALLEESLTGFEFAAGIPGSFGGALFMNAGAYGGEMKQIVKSVRGVAPNGKSERIFSAEEMDFGYRHSVFQENGYIAVEAVLELRKGDKASIAAEMKELAYRRNSKQPLRYPSAGSTFKRPEGHFAGKLIEEAGLKGASIGGAQVSDLHSGFIINRDNATATDILKLITLVQNRVYDETGIMLEPEVRIIG